MKIVVLAGGTSTERDVSLITGKMVYQALCTKGHQVVLLDVFLGYEGADMTSVFEIEKDWSEEINQITEKDPDIEQIKALRSDGGKSFFGPNVLTICSQADIVFMGLHGANGEDGKVQATFDLCGIKYTGSGYVGAALSMDKGLSKQLFRLNHINTPKGITVKKENQDQALVLRGEEGVDYPVVVKTCCGGSSVGVYIVANDEEYKDALKAAFSYEDEVVVEQYIKGREFSVGVMEGKALPIIEIAPIQGFYDYKNKYQAGSAIETCPAELSDEITKKMQKMAEEVFAALRLETYARMDFLLREDDEIFCLEGNTLPGMTKTSLLPQEAAAMGIGYVELCEKIIEISMKKYGADGK